MINVTFLSRDSQVRMISILLICCSFAWVSQAQELPPEVLRYADIVLFNGQVLTMDRDQPPITVAQALAIRDGRILAVAGDDPIRRLAGPETLQVDLQGRAVMPGVVDTHSHPNSYALFHRDWAREVNQKYVQFLRENDVHYTNVRWDSKETALADLKTFAQQTPEGKWIYTRMGIDERLHKIFYDITRYDLDQSVPDHPLFIVSGYGLWGLVNTQMIELVKDTYGKLLPGFIKDQQGVPNGQLLGAAGEILETELMPQRPPELLAPYFKRELEEWVAIGVTTLSTRLRGYEISSYALLDRQGQLPLRMAYANELARANPYLERHLKRWGNLEGHGTDRMWLVGISAGNPDGYGPSPRLPTDDVWVGEVSCVSLEKREVLPNDLYPEDGMCIWALPDDPGRDAARIVNQYGYRITGTHTFGDKGIAMALDSYEEATRESSIKERRFALDHGMMIRPDLRERSAELGVMWSLQPTLFWRRYGAGVSRVYGEEYAHRWLFPVKSLLDQGVRVAYGADTHNDPERHPMFGLEVLVTRKTRDGRVFGPRERIDRSSGLLMMTRWGSEYVLAEDKLGSIEPGKLADLVVLDKNPLDGSIADEDLSEIEVLATIIGGEIVYGSLP